MSQGTTTMSSNVVLPEQPKAQPSVSPWRLVWNRFKRHKAVWSVPFCCTAGDPVFLCLFNCALDGS